MAKNLMIIGNGFDLDLKLKTSYADFVDYVINDNKITNNDLFTYIKEDYKTKGWIDVEVSLKEYVISLSEQNNGKNDKERVSQAEIVKKEFDEISLALQNYMKSNRIGSQLSSSVASRVFQTVYSKKNFMLIRNNTYIKIRLCR